MKRLYKIVIFFFFIFFIGIYVSVKSIDNSFSIDSTETVVTSYSLLKHVSQVRYELY